MIRKIEAVLLSSPNAKKLAAFYTAKVGVKFQFEGEMGDGDNVYGASWKNSSDFVVMDHSKVKAASREPERYMINFEVDDIEKEFARVKKAGVKVISPIYHIESYGHVATFEDPDGNFFQFVQVRAKK
jgi:predicted enzyme related to lactoylglutathione lyase